MKFKYVIYAAIVIGFAALIVYRIVSTKGDEKGGATGGNRPGGSGQAMKVDGLVIKPGPFDNILAITGSIDANEQVVIKGEVSGLVRGIYFQEGGNVKKGETLLKIDDSELRAQLSQALTRQTLAAENEKRARQLLEKEAISREEYDAILAELRALKSQTELVRAQIAKTVVTAPFNGKIGLRAISVGEYLVPTTAVTTLVNMNPVKITFSIPEKYSRQVKPNTVIKLKVAGSEKEYTARVYAVEPRIEAATRSLQLRARADNADGSLIPGSFANISFPLTSLKDAILVPTQAIVPVQTGKKVFITAGGKAKEVMVETGTRTEKEILVTSGLKAGDTVLTTGVMTLKEGSPVKVNTGKKINSI